MASGLFLYTKLGPVSGTKFFSQLTEKIPKKVRKSPGHIKDFFCVSVHRVINFNWVFRHFVGKYADTLLIWSTDV